MRGSGVKITHSQVRELLTYQESTGDLIWAQSKRSNVVGKVAGSVDRDGYKYIVVLQRKYKLHRILWLWWYGYFPEHDIDHIDGDKLNNRVENLRETTDLCNCRNRGLRKDNKSGIPGVRWKARSNCWQATITNQGAKKHLGNFQTKREAVIRRHEAEVEYDWPNCQTSSPAKLFLDACKITL